MSGLAAYQPYLAKIDQSWSPRQSFRIDYLGKHGWAVKVYGEYLAEFDTREEAQRWLAGLLLAMSTVPEEPT